MPAWTVIELAHLDTAKAAALVEALRTAALGDDQEDPLPGIITDSVLRIRQEIAAGGRVRLSATPGSVPPSLKRLALRMILREGQSRLNAVGAMPLSDDERKEWDKDDRYLERIAKGEITPEEPDDPEPAPSVQAVVFPPMIAADDRRFGRASQDGL
jgi:hypothetical protein